MRIRSFEFNLRELAGSMGDFGTLLPLAVGYFAVCGIDPAGLLVMMGLANVATGLIYRLPLPIEPMKVLAVVAIAEKWSPGMVYASALGMGIVWVVMAGTGAMRWVGRHTPRPVVRGIQVSLGIMLALQALKLISSWWLLGAVCVVLVLLLRTNRYAPAAIVLVVLGLVTMAARGGLQEIARPAFTLPPLTCPRPTEVWSALVKGGFAQIPLTATNAVIATAALISGYWPGREVSEKKSSLNMGIMNLVVPFFGGMPMCHGSGGLASQYYFGARTGGANLIEGFLEIFLGLFMAASIAGIFAAFPAAILGAMMFLVGVELTKFARDVRANLDLAPLGATVAGSLLANMAVGFIAGLAVHHALRRGRGA